jgi:hypothetical protein
MIPLTAEQIDYAKRIAKLGKTGTGTGRPMENVGVNAPLRERFVALILWVDGFGKLGR